MEIICDSGILKNFVIPIICAFIGGGLTLLGIYFSIKSSFKQMHEEFKIEREESRKNSIMAIKTELIENKSRIDKYSENINKSGQGVKTMCIQLSDSSWNSFKHEICKYDEKTLIPICNAYADINKVNNLTTTALSFSHSHILPEFPVMIQEAVTKAKNSLGEALKSLNDAAMLGGK
jgi:hypothetical protein